MTIVKKYLGIVTSDRIEDVHSNPAYFQQGIDLILHHADSSRTSVDLKVDSYYGSDPDRKPTRGLWNPDSGYILLETISQLQYERETTPYNGTLRIRNRHDAPGWFFTSAADEVYYYFLAVLSSPAELKGFYSEYQDLLKRKQPTEDLEEKMLQSLKVDQDLLVSYPLNRARDWYGHATPDAFGGFIGASNPHYVTVSRRAYRDRFISELPATSHGPIFRKL